MLIQLLGRWADEHRSLLAARGSQRSPKGLPVRPLLLLLLRLVLLRLVLLRLVLLLLLRRVLLLLLLLLGLVLLRRELWSTVDAS